METLYFKISEFISKKFKTQIRPISELEMKYYMLLQTIKKGALLSEQDLTLIHSLPRENLVTILKLYNIHIHNLQTVVDLIEIEL